MKLIRSAADRGHTQIDWLSSRHSFSFGGYYDPNWNGWGPLRVINDDHVAPGGGFSPHPHKDMEIFSYVTKGALAHNDSLGNEATMIPGRIQLMTAGSGIVHSEYNGSQDEPTSFLQIWIEPAQRSLAPEYQDIEFDPELTQDKWLALMTPKGENGSLKIHQDASVSVSRLLSDKTLEVPSSIGRKGYLHLVSGIITIDGVKLGSGDALAFEEEEVIPIRAVEDAEILHFDLPK
jgi:redox-sensitive bicupin YhaK (pirin superfamily)